MEKNDYYSTGIATNHHYKYFTLCSFPIPSYGLVLCSWHALMIPVCVLDFAFCSYSTEPV